MVLEKLNLVELNESEKKDISGGFFGWYPAVRLPYRNYF